MRHDERDALELIGRIYDAALEPEGWPAVMELVERRLRSTSSSLYLHDSHSGQASFQVVRGLDDALMRQYHSELIHVDPIYAYRSRQPVGTVMASHHALPDSEYAATEFFNEFMRPQGRYYAAGGIVAREDGRHAVFSVHRSKRAGPFEEPELRELRALFPHLRRAFTIGRYLAMGEVERQAMLALLERLPTGVILLDEAAQVVLCNHRAEAVLTAGDGPVLEGRRLTVLSPPQRPVLEQLVHDAVATGAGRGTSPGGAVTLPVVGSREAYQLVVTPLRTERVPMDLGTERICAAVFVQLRGTNPLLSPEILRGLFGLTAAEARVAAALVEGRSAGEIAHIGETSRHTVRAQLSAIYDKLGVHRQAEAVQRLLASPASLSRDDTQV